MFDKKCSRCNNKIKDKYDFCPVCGNDLRTSDDEKDFGMIGKNDLIDENFFPRNDSMMDKIFNNAFKMAEKLMEKQMKTMSEEINQKPRITQNMPGVDIQFFVNGKRVFPDANGVMRPAMGSGVMKPAPKKPIPVKVNNKISEEKMKSVSKFPRKEAVSKVRRLEGKIIYELQIPGVDDIDNVLINQLENSIEIKALGKDKVYHKTLNINLPILKYGLNEGNLVLELAQSKVQ